MSATTSSSGCTATRAAGPTAPPVIDPRTGEIIKGHVSLGSLRVRQDYLIAEGLLAPYETGKPASPEMEQMALARLRQLSAHEVGHTLGIAHNYIASTANRASVMDYPHPFSQLRTDGTVSLTDAYATGIGEWDKVAVAYGYTPLPAGVDETPALNAILADARARGLHYLTDKDARPLGRPRRKPISGTAGPTRSTNSSACSVCARPHSRVSAKTRSSPAVRSPCWRSARAALPDAPYQIEAASKSIAGTAYTYALRGDGQVPLTPVPPAEQRRALAALLATVTPG